MEKKAIDLKGLLKATKSLKEKGTQHIRKNLDIMGNSPSNVMYHTVDNPNMPRNLSGGLANLPKAVYMKGDVRRIVENAIPNLPKIKNDGQTKAALNTNVFLHEAGEGYSAKRGLHTMHGAAFGHPNLSRTIGNESNILATGDSAIKETAPWFKKLRNSRVGGNGTSVVGQTEEQAMQELMPKGVDGIKHPFEYGKTRLNRRMREEMMKKEFGLSAHTPRSEALKIYKQNGKTMQNSILGKE